MVQLEVVNTGFKPGWIMIKSTAGNDNWRLCTILQEEITAGGFLEANRTDAETAVSTIILIFYQMGLKLLQGEHCWKNVNGNLYTYYAFASDQSAAPVLADSFANKLYTWDW